MSYNTQHVGRREFLAAATVGASIGIAGCIGDDDDDAVLRWGATSGAEIGTLTGMFGEPEFRDAVGEEVMPNFGEYEVERTATAGTAPAVSAMGAGEMDGGVLAPPSIASGIREEVIPGGVSVIFPQVWVDAALPFNIPKVSRLDSGIETVEDMEGQTYGVNAFGGTSDIAARRYLTEHDLEPDVDVEFVELGFGAMGSALDEGRIDVGTMIQPIWEGEREDSQVVFDQGDVYDNHITLFSTIRNEYADENPDIVEMWIEDNWAATQWVVDPDNQAEALEIASNITDLPEDVLEHAMPGGERGYYVSQGGFRMEADFIQPAIDGMAEFGFIEEPVDISEHLTNEFLPEEADQFPDFV